LSPTRRLVAVDDLHGFERLGGRREWKAAQRGERCGGLDEVTAGLHVSIFHFCSGKLRVRIPA
jgi:hypothetical protein